MTFLEILDAIALVFCTIFPLSVIGNCLRKKKLNLELYAWVCMFFLYSIPALILFAVNMGADINIENPYHVSAIERIGDYPLNVFVMLGMGALFLGYKVTSKIRIKAACRKGNSLIIRPKVMLYFLLIIGIVSLYLFYSGFGGVLEAMFYSNFVRSGSFKEVWQGDTGFLFYKRFVFLLVIPIIFGLVYSKNFRDKVLLIYLPVVIYLSFLIFLNKGRQAVIDLALIYLFGKVINNSLKLRTIGIIAPFLLVSLLGLDYIFAKSFVSTEGVASESVASRVFTEFGTTYLSIGLSLISESKNILFSDYFYALFGNIFPTYSDWVTREVNYINSVEFGSTDSSYPPGVLAFGGYNLYLVGFVVYPFLIGIFLKIQDKIGIALSEVLKGGEFLYAYLIVNSMVILRTGAPRYYFYDVLNISIFLFLVLAFSWRVFRIK